MERATFWWLCRGNLGPKLRTSRAFKKEANTTPPMAIPALHGPYNRHGSRNRAGFDIDRRYLSAAHGSHADIAVVSV